MAADGLDLGTTMPSAALYTVYAGQMGPCVTPLPCGEMIEYANIFLCFLNKLAQNEKKHTLMHLFYIKLPKIINFSTCWKKSTHVKTDHKQTNLFFELN